MCVGATVYGWVAGCVSKFVCSFLVLVACVIGMKG